MIKKYKLLILALLVFIIIFAYIFAIKGKKTHNKDISWIREIPIAHRGLDNGDTPENSMEAFKKAIEKGYAIELDVQLTKDKELIVFHDSNLERLTKDKRDVADVTYDEINSLKLENTNETIPTLKDVLKLVDNKVPLLIEIKTGNNAKEIAESTYNIVKDYNGIYAIESFDPFILEWFKNNAKQVIRCQLSGGFKWKENDNLKWYEKFLLRNLLLNFKSRPHAIAYELKDIDNLSVKLLKGKYPIISWPITDEEDMKKGYEKSDNIIFDNILP